MCVLTTAPHSPRRQKLNLRMKSLSLDSPESTEHVQRRRHVGTAGTSEPQSNNSSSSRIQCMNYSLPVQLFCLCLLCAKSVLGLLYYYLLFSVYICVYVLVCVPLFCMLIYMCNTMTYASQNSIATSKYQRSISTS